MSPISVNLRVNSGILPLLIFWMVWTFGLLQRCTGHKHNCFTVSNRTAALDYSQWTEPTASEVNEGPHKPKLQYHTSNKSHVFLPANKNNKKA